MASSIPVVGPPSIQTTDGSVPLRLEVRSLQQSNPDQWNLYLLGLDALHNNTNESESLSYFQIAGIHGRPYVDWNQVAGVPGDHWDGYCTHSSILFAPWHRPYLALYEQVLYSAIQEIASKYSGDAKTRYEGAASTFRLPYWDWAINPPDASFPSSISSSDMVDVLAPGSDGSPVQKQIPNPLYSYSFDLDYVNNNSWFNSPENAWATTIRYPTQDDSGNTVSNDAQVNDAIANQIMSIQGNVYLIMSSFTDFAAFSNTQWNQSGNAGTYGSLEDIHDDIHATVGGGGHMSDPDYSAFDPVFWLHHCNIDRLLAMWQAINPGSYVVEINSREGTYTWPVNSPENEDTPLTPFHRTAEGQFWKSVDVVKTETFQYAYPETQEWAFPDNQAYQSSVRTAIKNLYGGSSPSALFESNAVLPPTRHLLVASKAKASNPAQKANPAPKEDTPAPKANPAPKQELKRDVPTSGDTNELSSLAPNGKYTEWIANIRAEKHALGGPYGVHVFLGDFNEDERTWPFEHNLVGTSSIFCRAAGTDCGKCKDDREAGLMVTGIVPLTFALIEDVREGLLRSLNAEDVVPYLTRKLHWRVTLADGSHKPREEVPNLKVSVVSSQVTVPTARDEFPVRSDYAVHAAVTQGRPTGHNAGDPI